MVSPPIHCPENSKYLELSIVWSVCHQKEQKKTTSVCVSSLEWPSLAEDALSNFSCCGKLPSDTDSSCMANPVLVQSSAGNVSRSSTETSVVPKVSDTDGKKTFFHSNLGHLKLPCLEAVKDSPETRIQSFWQNPGTSTQIYQEIIRSKMKHLLFLMQVQRKKSSQGLFPLDIRFPFQVKEIESQNNRRI